MPEQVGKVLIVGTGYSGTTFLSRVLMTAGCDFGQGDPPASWTMGPRSIEHPAILYGSNHVYQLLHHPTLRMPDYSRTDEAVRECQRSLDAALAVWPPFVKSPVMGYVLPAWLRAGLQPRAFIICFRRLEETFQSVLRQQQLYDLGIGYQWKDTAEDRRRLLTFFGMVMDNVLAANVPWTVVRFPSSVEAASAGPIYDDLQANIGLPCSRDAFLAAHARAADPELVHVRRGEPWEPLPRRS